jgi:glucosyl-3-phosphoglycerate synthase
MADFMQTGSIATIHALKPDHWHRLDADLRRWGRRKPLGLVLPALYVEFENPAIHQILAELEKVNWIERIVLVLSQADEEQYDHVSRLFARFGERATVLWRESAEVQAMLAEVNEAGFPADVPGKGRACWMGMGYLLSRGDVEVIAFQDCDIKTYHRQMLARLVAPLMAPGLEFEFSKAYYARFSHKLNGRLTRLMVGPLLAALRRCGVESRFLDYLGWFRYPLSGEIAMDARLARQMHVAPDWGLEISTLAEVYRRVPLERVCQVDVADCYDHKHQTVSAADPGKGLHRMAREVAQAILRGAAADGTVFSTELLTATLPLACRAEALHAVVRYHADAMLNGLEYDLRAETDSAEVFARGVEEAAAEFLANPCGRLPLPAWQEVEAALPEVFDHFDAVARMNTEWTEQQATA